MGPPTLKPVGTPVEDLDEKQVLFAFMRYSPVALAYIFPKVRLPSEPPPKPGVLIRWCRSWWKLWTDDASPRVVPSRCEH